MRRGKRRLCTKETEGVITQVKFRGGDNPTSVEVEYSVGETVFRLRDTVKYRSEWIRIGRFPVGQRKIPKIRPAAGNCVRVRYNPEKPGQAYLPENTGWMNC